MEHDEPAMDIDEFDSASISKEARAAFWGVSSQQAVEEQESVDPEERRVGDPKRRTTDAVGMLSHELSLPRDICRDACEIFSRFATPGDSMEQRLNENQFTLLLVQMCECASVDELPASFRDTATMAAFKTIDKDGSGDIDMREFCTWFSSFSFANELVLGKDKQEVRKLARRLGMEVVDIERYKRAYDDFDLDGSGLIDFEEFQALVYKLLKVPHGQQLPEKRLMSLWNEADANGSGEIDFEEFCVFYEKCFQNEEGVFNFADYYRNIRHVPHND